MHQRQSILIRRASAADVGELAELNRAAYPDLIEDGVVFSHEQLSAHIARFAHGQLVAETAGRLVGAAATLVLPSAIDALAQHTWVGVTDGGFFTRHDEAGRTLYLADIYVHPDWWGRGVGQALYGAIRDLCRELGKDHVIAGGRLWGYADVAHRMTAREYVDQVLRGQIVDRVLNSQVRAGFVVRGILRDYLHDWRSRNYATLLEWVNPDRAVVTPVESSSPPASVRLWPTRD
jgi:GNAT superfamily N-acetyltransferase